MNKTLKFSKKSRLLSSKEFQELRSSTHKIVKSRFLLVIKPNQRDYPRLGITVPKKYVRKAVDRNRIKRILRESFRHYQHKLGGQDIIFISRMHIEEIDNKELRKRLDEQWENLIKQ